MEKETKPRSTTTLSAEDLEILEAIRALLHQSEGKLSNAVIVRRAIREFLAEQTERRRRA